MTLADDLRALGASGVVMPHVSMRKVGGQAQDLLSALLSVAHTVMAYVDFAPVDGVFDPLWSPASFDYGIFAELVRHDPRTLHSQNPGARMAAIGEKAKWLCTEHPLNYGYGPGSPLAKLVEADGAVLVLGADWDHVTLLHYAEHMARVPNKPIVQQRVQTTGGVLEIEEFDTSAPIVGPEDYFAEIVRAFVDAGKARQGKVGGADSLLLPARALAEFAIAKMEREFGAASVGAKDKSR